MVSLKSTDNVLKLSSVMLHVGFFVFFIPACWPSVVINLYFKKRTYLAKHTHTPLGVMYAGVTTSLPCVLREGQGMYYPHPTHRGSAAL